MNVGKNSGGSRISQRGRQLIIQPKFLIKMHENEENWTKAGGGAKFYYVDPPLESSNLESMFSGDCTVFLEHVTIMTTYCFCFQTTFAAQIKMKLTKVPSDISVFLILN